MAIDSTISLFLFLEGKKTHRNLSYKWLEESFGFSCLNYDEDCCEVGGSNPWNLILLSSAFKPMSHSEHWAEQAIRDANKLGIKKCRRALIVGWEDYQPRKFKKKRPPDPILIGPYRFTWETNY